MNKLIDSTLSFYINYRTGVATVEKQCKMKRLFTFFAIALTFVASSCNKFDDSDIWDKLNEHDKRITALEELCKQMNTNIVALQTVVNALQKNDYITNVSPVRKDGEVVGYTITFAHSDTITIYHGTNGKDGANGKDGYTPQIGVMKDTDGIYYWTVDGEWLLDGKGNKVQANGVNGTDGKDGNDGADGITPRLKIENDYWYVSYDNGATWTKLGKATGEDGDSIFSSVTQDDGCAYIKLQNGETFTIPLYNALSITLDVSENVIVNSNAVIDVKYTIESNLGNITIEVLPSSNITAVVNDKHALVGTISIKLGNDIDCQSSKVVILVSNGEKVIMRSIYFEQASVQVVDSTIKTISMNGGEIRLEYLSNIECEIIIPSTATNWLSILPNTRVFQKKSTTLKAEVNNGSYRTANVVVKAITGGEELVYTIIQEGKTVSIDYITNNGKPVEPNTTNGFGANFITNVFDTTSSKGSLIFDGKITNIPSGAFMNCTNLEWIDIPSDISAIRSYAFKGCSAITHICIPESVIAIEQFAFEGCTGSATINCKIGTTSFASALFSNIEIGNNTSSIGIRAFDNCTSIKSITIPQSITSIDSYAFNGCSSIENVYYEGDISKWCNNIYFAKYSSNPLHNGANLHIRGIEVSNIEIPSSITCIRPYAFYGCKNISSVIIPQKVTEISEYAFSHCSSLSNIVIPESITEIKNSVFSLCNNLTSIIIPSSIETIGYHAFFNCTNLRHVYCKATIPPVGYDDMFYGNAEERKIYVPRESVDTYKKTPRWNVYADDIEPYDY